ncbi:hypothetical protein [Natrarchaeobaculum aegyptiacum]|uniref:hypothetical protein n=1 Tax=Natrarchaeobaculum aegyptiacum TaxID=745377 RepID=UPI0016428CE1|nr:hypothetical protein [Natrarchaeobaculum aegyptiacum]
MATRAGLECPVCHEEIGRGEQLEAHLYNDHSKRALAGFVATEAVAMEEDDISE